MNLRVNETVRSSKTRWCAAALLLAALAMPAQAAEAPAKKRHVVTFSSRSPDHNLCRRLVEGAERVRYIEPYLKSGWATDLGIGFNDAPRERLYFTHRPMSTQERYRLIKRRDWMALFGEKPAGIDTVPGYVSREPRFRPLKRKCPELFHARHHRTGKIFIAPQRVALYRADLDNDGDEDTVMFAEFDVPYNKAGTWFNVVFDIVDFDRCAKSVVYSQHHASRLFSWDGEVFVEGTDPGFGGNTYVFQKSWREPTTRHSYYLCRYGDFEGFDKIPDLKTKFHIDLKEVK